MTFPPRAREIAGAIVKLNAVRELMRKDNRRRVFAQPIRRDVEARVRAIESCPVTGIPCCDIELVACATGSAGGEARFAVAEFFYHDLPALLGVAERVVRHRGGPPTGSFHSCIPQNAEVL